MVITLSERGQKLTLDNARARFESSQNLPDQHGRVGKSFHEEIDSMGAEVALVELLSISGWLSDENQKVLQSWEPGVNTFKTKPDIPLGPGIEVRWSAPAHHRLIIRDDDDPDKIYCYMWGKFPTYGYGGFHLKPNAEDDLEWKDDFNTGREKVWGFYPAQRNTKWADLIELVQQRMAA